MLRRLTISPLLQNIVQRHSSNMAKLKQPKESLSSSFHFITLKCTPGQLIQVAEKYNISYIENKEGDGNKVNFEFEFETEDGLFFTAYDWKEYRPLELGETIEFHIGAKDEMDPKQGKEILQHEIGNL